MWNYEKRLEYPINIKRTDAAMAKAIISQFGGPDGETGAAMRYLSQRFAMPYRPVMGVLTDVGIEASNSDLPQPKHSPRRLSSGASLLPAAITSTSRQPSGLRAYHQPYLLPLA